jgi:hypothetical protein
MRSIITTRFSRTASALAAVSFLLCFCATAPAASPSLAPNNTPIDNPEKFGADLAARLRSAAPSKDAGFEFKRTGKLEVTTRDDKTFSIPFQYLVTTTATNWLISYAGFPGEKESETLAITIAPGQSNHYALSSGGGGSNGAAGSRVLELRSADLVRPFAGTDFWVFDLGLEFLYWPQQRVLRHEMRSSLSCWVLESTTPSPVPAGYARVLSWVTVEYGEALLHAKAYDKAGKLVKEFSIGSVVKVNGQPELKSMKIRNLRTGQETELKFDLPK